MIIAAFGFDAGDAADVSYPEHETTGIHISSAFELGLGDAAMLKRLIGRANNGLRVQTFQLTSKGTVHSRIRRDVATLISALQPQVLTFSVEVSEQLLTGAFSRIVSSVRPKELRLFVTETGTGILRFLELAVSKWSPLDRLVLAGHWTAAHEHVHPLHSVVTMARQVDLRLSHPSRGVADSILLVPPKRSRFSTLVKRMLQRALPPGTTITRVAYNDGIVTCLGIELTGPCTSDCFDALRPLGSLKSLEINASARIAPPHASRSTQKRIFETVTSFARLERIDLGVVCCGLTTPVLRAAIGHPSLKHVELSSHCTSEQCFRDTAHATIDLIASNSGVETLCGQLRLLESDCWGLPIALAVNTRLRRIELPTHSSCVEADPISAGLVAAHNYTIEHYCGHDFKDRAALNRVGTARLGRWLPRDLVGAVAEFLGLGAAKTLHRMCKKRGTRELPGEGPPRKRRRLVE